MESEYKLYMKAIYIGYPVSKQNEILHKWSIADNNMEIGFIEQLIRLYKSQNVHVFSMDLIHGFKNKLFVKSVTSHLFDNVNIKYVSYINIPRLRVFLIYLNLLIEIIKINAKCKLLKEDCIVIVYNVSVLSIFFNLIKKILGIKTVCFLAGVVENYKFDSKGNHISNLIRRISFSSNDGIITFNKKSANDYFKKKQKLIIYPGTTSNSNEKRKVRIDYKQIILLFTGEVTEHNGINIILDSLKYLPKNYLVKIYGRGNLVNKVIEKSKNENRIQYCGFISQSEVLKAQKNADILILLRTGSINLSKYAISSKIIEYLESGTPIVANKVESLPLEFHNYINFIEATTIDFVSKIASITENESIYLEYIKKSELGIRFVEKNCNWQVNGDKIGVFLQNLFIKEK